MTRRDPAAPDADREVRGGGGRSMKKSPVIPIVLLLLAWLSACSEERPEKEKVLARINDYELTLSEFETKLVGNLPPDQDSDLTQEMKEMYLDQLIRKEVLIQEARRLKLDRKEKFIRAMEKYWEQTLIRDLYEAKSESLSQKGYVTSEEIQSFYNKMKQADPATPPFEEVRDRIAEELKAQKERERLMAWERALIEKAQIEIDKEILSKNW